MSKSGNVIGIDLGTTTTLVARFNEAGKPEITTNSEGSRITPSVIQIEDSGDVIVGTEAKKFLGTGIPNVFAEFKRVIGEPGKSWLVGGKEITPADLSALLLKKVVQDYAAQFGQPDSIVISWPANFRNEQREATKAAAAKAGLKVEYYIEEPVAAALFYSTQNSLNGKYLVYDFGGGTFDVTLLEAHGKEITILYHEGVQQLGGKDLDDALNKLIGDKFTTKTGDVFDPVDCNFTKLDTESAKHTLSTRDKTAVRLVSAKHGMVAIELTREEFESAISSLISQAEMACENVLKCGQTDPSKYVKKSEVVEVFMAGGTSRVPATQKSMERLFGKPPKVIEPDAAIALGASVYSAFKTSAGGVLNPLQQQAVNDVEVDLIAPHFFGTSVLEDDHSGMFNDTIIRKGTKLPCKESRQYGIVRDNQDNVNCDVTQSAIEERNPEYVTKIWEGNLPLPAGLSAGHPICVTFAYDINGTMNVSFKEGECGARGGKEVTVDLRPGH
jgi:molecular chaperone DnaK (HSP70)